MCGRFLLTSPPEAVARVFGVDVRDNFPPRWNIAPSQAIAVIRIDDAAASSGGAPAYALMRWGFIPSWAKGERLQQLASRPLINARSETAAEKPTFRNAWKRRRCLVPANGFYEWRRQGNVRTPHRFTPADQSAGEGLVGFAALWETAHDPDGGEIDTVAILTIAAGPDTAPLHDREPVVVPRALYRDWVGSDQRNAGAMGEILAPAPAGFWRTIEVPKDLNDARKEGSRLSEETRQGELF